MEYNNLSFFKSFLEADEAPDAAMASSAGDTSMDGPPPENISSSTPNDLPDVPTDDGPPDLGSEDDFPVDDAGNMEDDGPPDFEGEGDEFGDEGESSEEDSEENKDPMDLDEKVSAIMNANLYSRFLTMLNNLGSQINQIHQNSDMIYAISPNASDIINNYKQLDENIRLYLKNSFLNENYSSNLLFFNKCLNLLKLLNDSFSSNINKGIKERT